MLPGLVMLEAAVRAAAAVWTADSTDGLRPVLDRVERLHVMRRVVPGETLVVTAEVMDGDGKTQVFNATGVVDGVTAMRATFRLRTTGSTREVIT